MPRRVPSDDLPDPWTQRADLHTGGLTGVGTDAASRYLLVVSHDGRGVFDLASGERVARDRGNVPDTEFRENPFTVGGIGPLAGTMIPCAGLWGGALPQVTPDGWRTTSTELVGPDGQRYALPEPDAHVAAVGFTSTGEVLIYATGASVTLYFRAA
jgi:hypothetical protein